MVSIGDEGSQSISQNVRMGIQYRFQQGRPDMTATEGKLAVLSAEEERLKHQIEEFAESGTETDLGGIQDRLLAMVESAEWVSVSKAGALMFPGELDSFRKGLKKQGVIG